MLVDTSEEWVLYNCSVALWSHTDKAKYKQPGQYALHYRAYPLGRAEGQQRFSRDPEFQITTKGADHPFHIHVNPCWVTRIDVPDERGRFHNILSAPQWMDSVAIPRGGRVVFRSRFADYTGMWVNHCHILMHEDHGMMQAVESVARAKDANYRTRTRVASHTMSGRRREHHLPTSVDRADVQAEHVVCRFQPRTRTRVPGVPFGSRHR